LQHGENNIQQENILILFWIILDALAIATTNKSPNAKK
jgi:hypothetical protein